ncbi:MAG TPA: DUF805 domain-containing protein [Candidatus Latescibacteria bacterium]|nr:DUF805 domain-containing protein [Candidatus Latescibacterota bacterium]
MGIFDAVKICFVKYTEFSDRSSRSEFWLFTLFTVIASLLTAFIPPVDTIVGLVLLVPSLSVSVRRLHDVNRSGWWLLIELTVIGIFLVLYWCCKKGDEGENRFGQKPLA